MTTKDRVGETHKACSDAPQSVCHLLSPSWSGATKHQRHDLRRVRCASPFPKMLAKHCSVKVILSHPKLLEARPGSLGCLDLCPRSLFKGCHSSSGLLGVLRSLHHTVADQTFKRLFDHVCGIMDSSTPQPMTDPVSGLPGCHLPFASWVGQDRLLTELHVGQLTFSA